jgi:hypothetical protein
MVKRNVRFDTMAGTPGFLYRVGDWVVANARLVDAETGEGIPGKYVLITILKDSAVLLHQYDYSRAPDGWVIKQVVASGDEGYSAVFYFPGDASYNSDTFTFSPTLPASLVAMATDLGIPIGDIPLGCNDMVVMDFQTPPTGNWYDIVGTIREDIWARYPGILVIKIQQYGNRVAVFCNGTTGTTSLLLPLVVIYIIVVTALIVAATVFVVLPKLINLWTLETYAKIKAQNSDRISEILADPTLTPEQKEALIQAILAEEVQEVPKGGWGIVDILKWGVILVGAAAAAYVVIAAAGAIRKRRG